MMLLGSMIFFSYADLILPKYCMQNPRDSAEQLVANRLCKDLNDPVQEL